MAATIEAPPKAPKDDPDWVIRELAGVKIRVHVSDANYYHPATGTYGPSLPRIVEIIARGRRLDEASLDRELREVALGVLDRWTGHGALTQPNKRALTKPQRSRIATAAVRAAKKELRERAKREAKAAREHERLLAQHQRQATQLKARWLRKHRDSTVAYVSLPDGVRPTRATSKDQTRPMLEGAAIKKVGRGKAARWVMQMTDTYGMLQVPLVAVGAGAIRETWVPPEALKAIEKARHFRVERDGTIQPVALKHEVVGSTKVRGLDDHVRRVWMSVAVATDISYRPRYDLNGGGWPKFDQLLTGPPPPTQTVRVKFDADLCGKLTAAAGKDKLGLVELVIDLRACDKRPNGERWFTGRRPTTKAGGGSAPLIVANVPDGAEALLMPVRIGV